MKQNLSITEWIMLFAMSLLVVFASAESAQATVLYVDGSRPSSGTGLSWAEAFMTIQEAVDGADANDEIWIKQGIYSLTAQITISKNVNLYGGFGGTEISRGQRDWVNNITTIDGQGSTNCFSVSTDMAIDGFTITNGRRAISISAPASSPANATIANCIFTNNSATGGGAIDSYHANLLLTNSRFEGNIGGSGGAIHNISATISIQECIFLANVSANGGGAINNSGATCDITNSLFQLNIANSSDGSGGGAIYYGNSSRGQILNCSFISNEALGPNGGGAIRVLNSTESRNVVIDSCEFLSNTTDWGGGAINSSDSPTIVKNCTFANNYAAKYGGAIWNWLGFTIVFPKILNCTFDGNSTDGTGGAISNAWSAPNITNCTFSNNSSTNVGGAIYNAGHTADNKHPKITNCILWNNTAPTNPEIGNSDSIPAVTYCDVQGGYSGTGNKNVDPMLDTNLRLLDGSPCLDVGSNSAPDILSTDKDGNPRIIDYDRNGVATVDMGAYEHGALAYQPHSGTINNDETWGPGTHYVTANVTVANNQVLTIQPGAVVKFAPASQLLAYGALIASGTSAGTIVFTSRDDDTYGETIIGSVGTPAAGDWNGIYLNGSSTYAGIGEFDHCLFRYGGNTDGLADANVYFYQSESGHMADCISEHSAKYGVRVSTCSPQITDSEFLYSEDSGLYLSGAGTPTITGNNFTGNKHYGATVLLSSMNPVISGNTGSGNLQANGLVFSGTVGADQTWASTPDFPIVVLSTVTVNNNVRLTIEPGTVVKFDITGQLSVNGVLDATGTDGDWVVFTSLKDDAYGGDTNGDGSATTPTAGDWRGIYLYGYSTNQGIGEFDHCLFRYGGNTNGSADANVYFYQSDSGQMADCISEHSAKYGVRISTCSPQITDSEFLYSEDSGLYLSGAGTPTITGNNFTGNKHYGATVLLSSMNPVISGNTGSGNLQANGLVFSGTVGADQTWASTPDFPIVVLSTVTVNNNVRLTIEPGTVVKFDITGQLSVNGVLDATGTDGDWVVFTSLKDDAYGGDTNGDGSATTPTAGDWRGIYLYGYSTNQGIGEFDHCLFRYGGNTNGSADANVVFLPIGIRPHGRLHQRAKSPARCTDLQLLTAHR